MKTYDIFEITCAIDVEFELNMCLTLAQLHSISEEASIS